MTRSAKVGFAVIALLALAALTHNLTGTTMEDLGKKPGDSEKEKSDEPVELDHGEPIVIPEPQGNPDATVKVAVYVTSDNDCDTTTLNFMKDMADRYGDLMYVEFGDMLDDEILEEAQAAKIGCKSGITINGQSRFLLPERGLKGMIMLDGPVGEKNYNMSDVEAIIRHLLESEGKSLEGIEEPGVPESTMHDGGASIDPDLVVPEKDVSAD